MSIDAIEKEALALPPHQRYALAERILRSTEPDTHPDIEAEWDAEIQSRIAALDAAHTNTHDARDVFSELGERLGS